MARRRDSRSKKGFNRLPGFFPGDIVEHSGCFVVCGIGIPEVAFELGGKFGRHDIDFNIFSSHNT